MYPRTRPNHRWVNQWKTMYVVVATLVVLGVLMVITAADVHSPTLGAFSVVTLFAAFTLGMITSIVQSVWLVQQPVSGRVVDRFVETSGFTPNELPLNSTLAEILDPDTDVVGLQHGETLYWLYVAPFNGSNLHRFLVTREVFDAHPLATDYNAANPATKKTVVTAESLPDNQRRDEVEHEEERVD